MSRAEHAHAPSIAEAQGGPVYRHEGGTTGHESHAHHHGHVHQFGHAHHHHHGQTASADKSALAAPPALSMLRMSLGARLAVATCLSALIWAGVYWAMA